MFIYFYLLTARQIVALMPTKRRVKDFFLYPSTKRFSIMNNQVPVCCVKKEVVSQGDK